jgi:thiamine biosynthesis protein ThiS
MDVKVNGETLSVPKDSSLTQLIELLSLGNNRIAVELNQEIVPRSEYDLLQLREGDSLEIVQAIGGG